MEKHVIQQVDMCGGFPAPNHAYPDFFMSSVLCQQNLFTFQVASPFFPLSVPVFLRSKRLDIAGFWVQFVQRLGFPASSPVWVACRLPNWPILSSPGRSVVQNPLGGTGPGMVGCTLTPTLPWHLTWGPYKREMIFQVPSHRCCVSGREGIDFELGNWGVQDTSKKPDAPGSH